MNRRYFAGLLASIAALIMVAVFYVTSGSDAGTDLADRAANPSGAAAASKSGIARADNTPEKKGNTPHNINPEDFTTAPKKGTIERRLVSVFTDRQLPDPEKVERLLGMVPGLSEADQKTAMDYATQLIADEDYLRQRPRLLRLASTDELREVVMLDMLTRDDTIKMTSLVELLSVPSKTTRSEAKQILQDFLEADHGDDPRKWDAPVQQWLALNAE